MLQRKNPDNSDTSSTEQLANNPHETKNGKELEPNQAFAKLQQLSDERHSDVSVQIPLQWIHKNEQGHWIISIQEKNLSVGSQNAPRDNLDDLTPRYLVAHMSAKNPEIYPSSPPEGAQIIKYDDLLTNISPKQKN